MTTCEYCFSNIEETPTVIDGMTFCNTDCLERYYIELEEQGVYSDRY